jgi:FtsP/CotA-like multicopper oxidase with cupredoxin domain
MDKNRIDARLPLGDVEIWDIFNDSPMAHPFHIHDTQFRILDRGGKPPHANELGLKDTVLINSRERVRVITRFENYADARSPYMFHCHILEHEDAGMMGQFVVVT